VTGTARCGATGLREEDRRPVPLPCGFANVRTSSAAVRPPNAGPYCHKYVRPYTFWATAMSSCGKRNDEHEMSAIYIETSIVGYLTARSGSDVVFQARQEPTRRWWQQRREGFDLYISQLVLDEVAAGDPEAADAQHVALAATAGVDYLLTWNCKHIANAHLLPDMYETLRAEGYLPPLIVTPEEFSDAG
jgi:hypothetical protein